MTVLALYCFREAGQEQGRRFVYGRPFYVHDAGLCVDGVAENHLRVVDAERTPLNEEKEIFWTKS